QANGGNGYADRSEPAISRFPAVGTTSSEPQFERCDRGGDELWRPHRRFRGAVRRLLDLHHSVWRGALPLHDDEYRAEGTGLGSVPVYSVEPLSFHARGDPGSGDYDEPESPGHEG